MPGGGSSGSTAMSVRRRPSGWRAGLGLALALLATSAVAPTRQWPTGHWCIHDLIRYLNPLFISPGA